MGLKRLLWQPVWDRFVERVFLKGLGGLSTLHSSSAIKCGHFCRFIKWLRSKRMRVSGCFHSGQLANRWFKVFKGIQVMCLGFPGGSVAKNLPASARDTGDAGLMPGSGRSPGRWNGNPLQYSCLGNPMDKRSLAGYSLWCQKESDTTERPSMHACKQCVFWG